MKSYIFKTDKVFIAGASGMVGSAIKRILLESKYCERILTPKRKELDLTNFNEVNVWFKNNKPDIVIIAAARVGGILANSKNPSDFLLDNLKIQTNLIELSQIHNVRRLLFLGSSCIYPKLAEQPIKEEYLLNGKLEKTNEWYAIAKIAGIKLCEALKIQKGFDSISLMPTNLYGPRDNYNTQESHVMAALIRKFYEAKKNNLESVSCWGSGSPLREFMHVDDLAKAVLFVLKKWKPSITDENFYLNVGTGKDISIKELAEKISNKFDYNGKIIWDHNKPDGTPKKQLDITKLKNLGWEPSIDLNEGLDKTINSFKEELSKNTCRL